MTTPKQITARFYKALKQKEQDYGKRFNKFLHLETGLSTGYISQILSGEKPGSQEAQMLICQKAGIDYNQLLEHPLSSETDTQSPASERDKNIAILEKHRRVLPDFKNPELALEVNEKLVEAEKSNPNILNEVLAFLKGRMTTEEPASKKQSPQERSSGS